MDISRGNCNYNLNDYSYMSSTNKLKILGKGEVYVKPDMAEVIIGFTTENLQLEIAQEENAKIMTGVINSIMELGVLPKDIQTLDYNIRANYDYSEGKQIFRGYEVVNNLKITVTDINSIGQIIDTAVRSGANNVRGMNFIVSDESVHYYEALGLAIEDAQNKGIIIANKLDVQLNITPIQITEKFTQNIVPLQTMIFKAANASTPIEAGKNRISAEIEVVFLYSNK